MTVETKNDPRSDVSQAITNTKTQMKMNDIINLAKNG